MTLLTFAWHLPKAIQCRSENEFVFEKCAQQYPQSPLISTRLFQAPQHAKAFHEWLYLPVFEQRQIWHGPVCWNYLIIQQSTGIRCFLFHVNLER